jgi:hypothetical protein
MNKTELGRKAASTVERDGLTCSWLTEPGAPDQANSAPGSMRFTSRQIAPPSNSMNLARQARNRTCLISSEMSNDAPTFNPVYKSGQTDLPSDKHLSESAIWAQ